MIQLLSIRLADSDAERVRLSTADVIRELQDTPIAQAKVIESVTLADAVITLVAHKLGRAPRITLVSPPRGPIAIGIIEERTIENPDRTKFVALKASGMGAIVTVDVLVI